MPILATVEKSPYATLTYTIDFTAWLPTGDTISAIVWTVPAGLTSVLESNTSTKASIKLSGGTQGKSYDVLCQIGSVGGLSDARTLRFTIEQR
jgi:hypothetical protein